VIRDTIAPPAPSPVSPENNENILDNTPTFEWTSVSDPSGVTYQIQVDNDPSFSSPEVDVAGWADNMYTPSELADGIYYWHIRSVDGVGNAGGWSEDWNFRVRTSVQFTLNLRAGWNMISFPVQPNDPNPDVIFSGLPYYCMYKWDTHYVLCAGTAVSNDEPVVPGVGYWVNVLAGENVVVSGTPVNSLTLSLSEGWNLIGPPLGGANIANPDDTPDNSVLPYAYTWDAENNRYVSTTDLVAGAGYWVNTLNSCVLRLPGGG